MSTSQNLEDLPNFLDPDTIFEVYYRHGTELYRIYDNDEIPSEVKIALIRGAYRPVSGDGTDFLGESFDGLYRGENRIITVYQVFDPSLGDLVFATTANSENNPSDVICKEYLLIPKK